MSRPLHKHRHPNAAFEKRQLPAAIRLVHLGQTDIARRPVVAGEYNDGVFRKAIVFKRLQHTPDAAIKRTHHRRVHAHPVILDLRQRVVVGFGSLQRRMNAPMREVKQERPVAVSTNRLDSLIGVIVSEIALRREFFPAVERGRVLTARPQKLVDRIEFQLRVHRLRVVLGQMQQTFQIDALVETLCVRREFLGATQVPLADMHRMIPGGLQHLGERDLRRRQALILERHLFAGSDLRPQQFMRPRSVVVEQIEHPAHTIGRGRKLETGARAVTPGHQHRPRRRARRRTRIGLHESCTILGDGVDMRRRYRAARHAAAEITDVVDAQIVGDNNDNVRRPLSDWHCRTVRPSVPHNLAIGSDRFQSPRRHEIEDQRLAKQVSRPRKSQNGHQRNQRVSLPAHLSLPKCLNRAHSKHRSAIAARPGAPPQPSRPGPAASGARLESC